MKPRLKLLTIAGLALTAITGAAILLYHNRPAVLDPKGFIGLKERDLIVTSTLLMLIVVVPVFILTFFIAWRYRDGNTKAKYRPDWDHDTRLELLWWGLPLAIITVLAAITWQSTKDLDPFEPLATSTKPMEIQVVALQWKWLFIYPQQNVASVNFVQFPAATPIDFEITSDAPMNSFWIPKLGGQIYAMSGMSTQLHLIANEPGEFDGLSANISGRGFSGMRFKAKSTSQADFVGWLSGVRNSDEQLDFIEYQRLSRPSQDVKPIYYASSQPGLYHQVITKFMGPQIGSEGRHY